MEPRRVLSHPALRYSVYRFVLQRLPLETAYALTHRFASVFSRFDPEGLKQAKNTLGKDRLPDTFQEMTQQIESAEILDTFVLANRRHRVSVTLNGIEQVKMLRRKNHKIILTTGHYGRYWPVGLGLNRAGLVSKAVIKDRLDVNAFGLPEAEFHFRRWKLHVMQDVFGCLFHTTNQHPRHLAQILLHHPIISLFDVPAESNSMRATPLTFFNRSIRANSNPARLAQIQDAYLVPFFNTGASNGHFEYQFFEPLRARDFTLAALNEQLFAILCAQIDKNPAAWWLWPALPHFLTETNDSIKQHTPATS